MISVIIPVYNVEKYLDQCVASVVAQTYTDFELLLIDDGSTDSSGQLCDQWQKRDPRIRVMHQPNQGVSAARNHGLDMAQGELVAFIDSDDWVDSDYLNQLVSHSCGGMTICGLRMEYEDKTFKDIIPANNVILFKTGKTKGLVELNEKCLLHSPYLRIFLTKIIKEYGMRFNECLLYGEDLMFNLQYIEYIDEIRCIDKALYHYRQVGNSSLSKRLRIDQFYNDYTQLKTLQTFLEKHGEWNHDTQCSIYRRLWGVIYDGLFMLLQTRNISFHYISQLLSIKEINQLKAFQSEFKGSKWIKFCILHRLSIAFYIFFKLKRLIHGATLCNLCHRKKEDRATIL